MVRRRPEIVRRPGPLARPRGAQLQLWRGPLSRAHLGFLLATAGYVIVQHPAALAPVLLVAVVGCIGELAPATWRRFFVAESLLLVSGVLSFLWVWNLGGPSFDHFGGERLEAFKGWVRIVFAAWLLIPSRPGYLRWMAALVAVELAVDGFADEISLTRATALVTTAILALGYDAHLRVATIRPDDVVVGRSRRRAALPWVGWTAALVAGLSMTSSLAVERLVDPPRQGQAAELGALEDGTRRLAPESPLDDDNFADESPYLMAQLTLPEEPGAGQIHYLRAMTLPELEFSRGELTWRAASELIHELPPEPQLYPHETRELASLTRSLDGSDTVLVPDGSARVGLFGLESDRDGNLFREGIGSINTRYRVDVGDVVHPRLAWEDRSGVRYLEIPRDLLRSLRFRIPQLENWRGLEPEAAATAITSWLQARCSYQIHDLPEPADSRAGHLMTFLFAERPERRVGHCRYFSTAAVLLLRAAGHPARYVVGYTSNEVRGRGVYFRARHAHAWLEVQVTWDDEVLWQRVDPTPSAHLTRGDGSDGGGDGEEPAGIPEPEDPNAALAARDWHQTLWWLGAAVLVLGSALTVWWFRRGESGPGGRQRLLDKRTESLIRTALDLGISIDRSTSLSSIARALEARTGIDLDDHLRAHLAARFGDGSMPEPWPLAELRAAADSAKQRADATASEAETPAP